MNNETAGANLAPLTYDEAMSLYSGNGRRPFSFLAAPYRIPKTIVVMNGSVVASPIQSAAAHYEWIARHRAARGIR